MTTLPRELQELVDRQQIYHVLTSYCRALDRCDVELMKSVYWEDGYDDHGVFAGNAQEFAEFIIRGIQEWFEVTQHTICTFIDRYGLAIGSGPECGSSVSSAGDRAPSRSRSWRRLTPAVPLSARRT